MDLIAALGRRIFGQAYLLLTLVALMWAGNAVAGRLAIGEVSPMMITSIRWVIVASVLGALARGHLKREWALLVPAWRRVLLLGSFGLTFYNALFYLAAHHTTAINLGMIQGIVPAMTMLGSRIVYGTHIRPPQALGLLVALAGVVLVASRGELAVLRHLDVNVGDLWMLAASLMYAGYTVALRNRPQVSGLTFFAALSIAAFVSSVPLLGYEIATGAAIWPSPTGWALLIYIAILPSLAAQLLYMRGVDLIGPGRTSVFVNLVPVFAALLGTLVLGETFAPYHALALTLVLGGIWLAERGHPPT